MLCYFFRLESSSKISDCKSRKNSIFSLRKQFIGFYSWKNTKMFTVPSKVRPPVLICISDSRASYWIVSTQLVGKLRISWPSFCLFLLIFYFINAYVSRLYLPYSNLMLPFQYIKARVKSFFLMQISRRCWNAFWLIKSWFDSK